MVTLTKPLTRKHFLAAVEKWARSGNSGDMETFGLSLNPFPDTVIPHDGDFFQESIHHPSSVTGHRSKEDLPMDFEKALAEFEGDRVFLMEVLKGFHEQCPTTD